MNAKNTSIEEPSSICYVVIRNFSDKRYLHFHTAIFLIYNYISCLILECDMSIGWGNCMNTVHERFFTRSCDQLDYYKAYPLQDKWLYKLI